MEFFEVVKNRHCCRNFDPNKKVSNEDIEKIIQAGKMAPSAGGIYPVGFEIIKNQKTKNSLAEAASQQNFIAEASIVLVIWADVDKTRQKYGERGQNLYAIQDAAAAAENIFLTTTALGLSACWVGAFDEQKVAKILNLKNNQRPLTIMPIGYPS